MPTLITRITPSRSPDFFAGLRALSPSLLSSPSSSPHSSSQLILPSKPSILRTRALILCSLLGALITEKYASTTSQKFLGGFITGIASNILAWQGSIPKRDVVLSAIFGGLGATSVKEITKFVYFKEPNTASAFGIFLGSIIPPLMLK